MVEQSFLTILNVRIPFYFLTVWQLPSPTIDNNYYREVEGLEVELVIDHIHVMKPP